MTLFGKEKTNRYNLFDCFKMFIFHSVVGTTHKKGQKNIIIIAKID